MKQLMSGAGDFGRVYDGRNISVLYNGSHQDSLIRAGHHFVCGGSLTRTHITDAFRAKSTTDGLVGDDAGIYGAFLGPRHE